MKGQTQERERRVNQYSLSTTEARSYEGLSDDEAKEESEVTTIRNTAEERKTFSC